MGLVRRTAMMQVHRTVVQVQAQRHSSHQEIQADLRREQEHLTPLLQQPYRA